MAFQGKYRSYSFTPVSVKQNAPPLPGVYALSNATEWILVGAAGDVRAALRAHLNETGTRVRTAAPTGFTFELCDSAAHAGRLERLIYELSPSCNDPVQG
jgi:hypothetical protein